MTATPDATLNYWGDRFSQSNLPSVMTFEQFMALNEPMRMRRLRMMEAAIDGKEARSGGSAELRGDRLVEPLHHTRKDHTTAGFRKRRLEGL